MGELAAELESDDFFTITDLAERFRVSEQTIRTEIKRGRLRASRIGRRRLVVSADDLDAYLSEQRQPGIDGAD